jgi:hypothetical protein
LAFLPDGFDLERVYRMPVGSDNTERDSRGNRIFSQLNENRPNGDFYVRGCARGARRLARKVCAPRRDRATRERRSSEFAVD